MTPYLAALDRRGRRRINIISRPDRPSSIVARQRIFAKTKNGDGRQQPQRRPGGSSGPL